METKTERLRIEGRLIKDILNKKFSKLMEEEKLNLDSIALIFISTEEKEGKKIITVLSLNHTNADELKNKIMHIDCPDDDKLNRMTKVLEKFRD